MAGKNTRLYFPTQTVETKEGYLLDVCGGGTVYLRKESTIEKLDSMWFDKLKFLAVPLPNGRLSKIVLRKVKGSMKLMEVGYYDNAEKADASKGIEKEAGKTNSQVDTKAP